ncbi:MAG: aldehyde dehydrogenase family protein [Actinobacteria bacterium]|nr:aldehyde dehydrogenase family protein [Ilumatobacteraceae bacterium]NMD23513.1 aldehyde dehydrogenase family protein [Actinomycetota bacterium]HQY86717.1 aldehyde dehydrogenase family protein [Ilumatobacteraceae bacterium]
MHVHSDLYIGGRWVPATSTDVIEVVNPATEEVIATVPAASTDDADAAVRAARAAFNSWSQLTVDERVDYVEKIAAAMAARAEEIASVVSAEQGMPMTNARRVQSGLPITVMKSYVDIGRQYARSEPEKVGNSIVVHEPIGVCTFITPWNYPLHQIVGKVAPALVAGCTMIVKPSSETPLNAFLLAQIIDEVGLPAGVFNLVTGAGRTVGEALCVHPDVDMISITGSTEAGARIATLGAPSVKRICQELGGKSANVILDGADLAAAVPAGVIGMMLNCGQTCTALTRMIVPRSRQQEVVDLAVGALATLAMGDPLSDGNFLGPVVSAAQKRTVQGYVRTGIEEGARVVAGGADDPEGFDTGFYVQPTIFADVVNSMVIAQEEIFGPVLCIIPVDSEEEAIAVANDSPYGLSGAVWADTNEHAIAVARRLQTGQVMVNGGRFNPLAPFGGYKTSGNGRELGRAGLDEFLETKAIQLPA